MHHVDLRRVLRPVDLQPSADEQFYLLLNPPRHYFICQPPQKEITVNKENSAPSTLLFDDFEGSPATRTRSKVRNMPFEFSVTLSPLNFRDTPQQRRRTEVERLLGDSPVLGVNATRRDTVAEMIDHGSPKAEKTGGGKPLAGKTQGKGWLFSQMEL